MHIKKVDINKVCILLIAVLFVATSCTKEYTAIEMIQKSVKTHGELSEWKNIHSLSFLKKTVLYRKDGSIEKEVLQKQLLLKDGSGGEIYSVHDSVFYKKQGTAIWKNDSLIIDEKEKTRIDKMFASAYYVISQPFHLLESQASFTIEKDTVINKSNVVAIKVLYPNDLEDSDQWTYYIDAKDFKVVACKVYHKPTTSFIENSSYNTLTPFIFNATRSSTFVKNGQKDYLRAKYWYSEYQVKFK